MTDPAHATYPARQVDEIFDDLVGQLSDVGERGARMAKDAEEARAKVSALQEENIQLRKVASSAKQVFAQEALDEFVSLMAEHHFTKEGSAHNEIAEDIQRNPELVLKIASNVIRNASLSPSIGEGVSTPPELFKSSSTQDVPAWAREALEDGWVDLVTKREGV